MARLVFGMNQSLDGYRGEAIADLVPNTPARKKGGVEAVRRLREFMLAEPIRGVDIKRLIEEGRG